MVPIIITSSLCVIHLSSLTIARSPASCVLWVPSGGILGVGFWGAFSRACGASLSVSPQVYKSS